MKAYLGAVAIAAVLSAGTAQAQSLGIGAGSQGSQNYAVNAGLGSFLTDKAGMDVRVQAFGGSGASMPLIDSGRLDLQAIVGPEVYAAVGGEAPFEGRAMENLRVVAALGPSTYGFFVREDSPYQTVDEIEGLSITYGFTAQPTLASQVDGILANGGLTIDDMQPVMVASVPNGADDFIAGNADVAFFALQGGKVQEADAAVGIRWLKLSEDPEAEAAMQEHVPSSYVQVVEPADSRPGIEEPTPMMAYDYLLTAGAHVDEETIYNVVKALAENVEAVQALTPTLSDFNVEAMRPALEGLTYHPGAERYYEEAGIGPNE